MTTTRRSKKLRDADEFREIVFALRRRDDVDWRPYEEKWLEDEAHRRDDYVYTARERKVLNRLLAAATVFTQYSGRSVPELIEAVYDYRSELDEHEEDFVVKHYNAGTTALPVRDICFLARLYRRREQLDLDEAVEAVLKETWTEDESKRGYEEPSWPLMSA